MYVNWTNWNSGAATQEAWIADMALAYNASAPTLYVPSSASLRARNGDAPLLWGRPSSIHCDPGLPPTRAPTRPSSGFWSRTGPSAGWISSRPRMTGARPGLLAVDFFPHLAALVESVTAAPPPRLLRLLRLLGVAM